MTSDSGSFRAARFRRKLSASEAQERVRGISWNSEDVIFTEHAEQRMQERGFSIPDILEILRGGYIDDAPTREFNGEWKCKVTMKYQTGRTVGVVTVMVDERNELIIVTVEWEDLI